jgi:hypothetical protein
MFDDFASDLLNGEVVFFPFDTKIFDSIFFFSFMLYLVILVNFISFIYFFRPESGTVRKHCFCWDLGLHILANGNDTVTFI